MNYLGHIYLSGENEQLMTGNFMGDYVKGKNYLNYPPEIQRGILLHRKIDHYTDQHPEWQNIREIIRPIYGRYAGVVADLFTDHVLARNWDRFSSIGLDWKAKWAYAALLKNHHYLPQRVQFFLPYLIQHRRLQSYSTTEGIDISLQIMSFRTSLPNQTKQAIQLLNEQYKAFELNGLSFLHDVRLYTEKLMIEDSVH